MHIASCIKMHNDSRDERSNPLHNARPFTRCTANSRPKVHKVYKVHC